MSFQSIFRELAKVTVIVAAAMVGFVSIGNVIGRVSWDGYRTSSPAVSLSSKAKKHMPNCAPDADRDQAHEREEMGRNGLDKRLRSEISSVVFFWMHAGCRTLTASF